MAEDPRSVLTGLLPRLRRFALTLSGSSADADDLVQATCERVLRHADSAEPRARWDAWLFGIMRNLWIDEIRRRKVRRQEPIDAVPEIAGVDGEAQVESRSTLATVRRELLALPEEQRVVLMLVCVDGLGYRQAAEVLAIPVGTVMSRLSRARRELHQRLSEQTSETNVSTFRVTREASARSTRRIRT